MSREVESCMPLVTTNWYDQLVHQGDLNISQAILLLLISRVFRLPEWQAMFPKALFPQQAIEIFNMRLMLVEHSEEFSDLGILIHHKAVLECLNKEQHETINI